MNYGYHLDAGKFAMLLKKHCIDALGVTYISDNVTGVNSGAMGEIASLNTQASGVLDGDLFIDCTGFAALLIGQHYQIPFKDERNVLFNDSALAVQIPYATEDAPIESCTLSTATEKGWVWDIGLPTRRGVGHVFSSAYSTDEQAEQTLRDYLAKSLGKAAAEKAMPRKLSFNPGYREKFWHKNCVAVGIAAGFIEPLEATALALIEASAQMISEQLPADHAVMDISAKRFNEKFRPRWARIIEFLKLHYVLSQRRDSEYWRDHCDPKTMPDSLAEYLKQWRYQLPWSYDAMYIAEMFPSASFQYILFGMGYQHEYPQSSKRNHSRNAEMAIRLFEENRKKSQQMVSRLPTNRDLLVKVREFGFQKI
jgi:hypothetical protein